MPIRERLSCCALPCPVPPQLPPRLEWWSHRVWCLGLRLGLESKLRFSLVSCVPPPTSSSVASPPWIPDPPAPLWLGWSLYRVYCELPARVYSSAADEGWCTSSSPPEVVPPFSPFKSPAVEPPPPDTPVERSPLNDRRSTRPVNDDTREIGSYPPLAPESPSLAAGVALLGGARVHLELQRVHLPLAARHREHRRLQQALLA